MYNNETLLYTCIVFLVNEGEGGNKIMVAFTVWYLGFYLQGYL